MAREERGDTRPEQAEVSREPLSAAGLQARENPGTFRPSACPQKTPIEVMTEEQARSGLCQAGRRRAYQAGPSSPCGLPEGIRRAGRPIRGFPADRPRRSSRARNVPLLLHQRSIGLGMAGADDPPPHGNRGAESGPLPCPPALLLRRDLVARGFSEPGLRVGPSPGAQTLPPEAEGATSG